MEENPFFNVANPMPLEFPHSRLGIASFILSLVCILALFGMMVVSVVAVSKYSPETIESFGEPGAVESFENVPVELVVAGLLLFFSGFALLVSVVLGVASFFQEQRKKIFGIIGVVLSGLIGLAFILLMIISVVARR